MLLVLSAAWKIAKLSIPIPLGVIFALGLAYQFLLPLRVRAAVNARVSEMVTQADKAALEAKLAAAGAREAKLNDLIREAQRRDNLVTTANETLKQKIAEDEAYAKEQEAEQLEIEKSPIGNGFVTPSIFKRLRNNKR